MKANPLSKDRGLCIFSEQMWQEDCTAGFLLSVFGG